jgi:hypothetical protein
LGGAQETLCVQGLSDLALATIDPDSLSAETSEQEERIERLTAMHEALGELIVARLGKLAPSARLPLDNGQEMVIVHGSPADPMEPMTFDMDDEELNALIGDDPADIIVCGGSHVPFERVVQDVHIVNVGSVGERPTKTVAHATIIETMPEMSTVEQFTIDL